MSIIQVVPRLGHAHRAHRRGVGVGDRGALDALLIPLRHTHLVHAVGDLDALGVEVRQAGEGEGPVTICGHLHRLTRGGTVCEELDRHGVGPDPVLVIGVVPHLLSGDRGLRVLHSVRDRPRVTVLRDLDRIVVATSRQLAVLDALLGHRVGDRLTLSRVLVQALKDVAPGAILSVTVQGDRVTRGHTVGVQLHQHGRSRVSVNTGPGLRHRDRHLPSDRVRHRETTSSSTRVGRGVARHLVLRDRVGDLLAGLELGQAREGALPFALGIQRQRLIVHDLTVGEEPDRHRVRTLAVLVVVVAPGLGDLDRRTLQAVSKRDSPVRRVLGQRHILSLRIENVTGRCRHLRHPVGAQRQVPKLRLAVSTRGHVRNRLAVEVGHRLAIGGG